MTTINNSPQCKRKLSYGQSDKLYSKSGKFEGFFEHDSDTRAYAISNTGYGRPQSALTSLKGKDGEMLIILQNKKTRKVIKKYDANWGELANKRFEELYGPMRNDVYRFNRWLKDKVGEEKAIEYREKIESFY